VSGRHNLQMTKRLLLFCFCLLNELEGFVTISPIKRSSRTTLHGGFGFGGTSNGSSKHSKKKKKKARLDGLESKPTEKSGLLDLEAEATQAKNLDKWGLPIQTEEEVLEQLFPPMPDGTELIPVDSSKDYSLFEIQGYLKGHIDLNLESCFDENGVEKSSDRREPMRLRLSHQSPPVLAIDNFFSSEECKELKSATSSGHEITSATFTGSLSTRTSTSWFCNYSDVPLLLAKSNQILNTPLETMEEPQIVRYQKGQEFSWHYDEVPAKALENGGQRLATLIVYLNDVNPESGGGTMFRDLTYRSETLVMQPKEGSALLFFPAFGDGRPDDRTLHRSEAMTGSDEKWIVQMWTHERKYAAVLPFGHSNDSAHQSMNEMIEKLGYNVENVG
jgi:prolyl 4-hydroxylase